jgi:hypothetical protein
MLFRHSRDWLLILAGRAARHVSVSSAADGGGGSLGGPISLLLNPPPAPRLGASSAGLNRLPLVQVSSVSASPGSRSDATPDRFLSNGGGSNSRGAIRGDGLADLHWSTPSDTAGGGPGRSPPSKRRRGASRSPPRPGRSGSGPSRLQGLSNFSSSNPPAPPPKPERSFAENR